MRLTTLFYKFIASLWLITFAFFGTAIIASSSSNLRALDGSLGLLRSPMSVGQKIMQETAYKVLMQPVETNALGFGDIFGPVRDAIKDVLGWAIQNLVKPLLDILFSILMSVYEAIIQPLISFVKDVLSFIDDFIQIMEQMADLIGSMRVGLAFKIFADIQNSSNIKSSGEFGLGLFIGNISQFSSLSSNSPNLVTARNITGSLFDGVAWLDFMNVLRATQADIVGDFVKQTLGLSVQNLDDMTSAVANLSSGAQCPASEFIYGGPFGPLFGGSNDCIVQNDGATLTALQNRQQEIAKMVSQKIQQFQLRSPADCKARGYIQVKDGSDFNYNIDSDSGSLDKKIMEVGARVDVITPTAQECEASKTLKQQSKVSILQQLSPSNLLVAVSNPAQFLTSIGQAFSSFFDDLKESIESRFRDAMDILRNIRSGNFGLFTAAFTLSTSIREQLTGKINGLDSSYSRLRSQVICTPVNGKIQGGKDKEAECNSLGLGGGASTNTNNAIDGGASVNTNNGINGGASVNTNNGINGGNSTNQGNGLDGGASTN